MSKALIIIDIQNDYFENGAMELVGALEASEKAKQVLSNFRENNLPIIHIQHLASASGTFFLPNTSGQEIHKNVTPLTGEKLIIKNYPNSFRETELLDYLKSENISELVLVGMMTHMCIDATVRAAKDFDFECTLISDATATRDLEINGKKVKADDVQNAFLAGLSSFYATVKTTEEYLLK
ncbi:MAG: cysteine hydrolase [Flavobacteriaceae bacterium]|uniref:Cysteine hydrolase n=1 Tax=Flavobacterium kayseriense TaxID=2764714 RepID=A0ABR7J994_9FLAO|nr:cysteine hydrolase family protein [Flavobacterium kayseriense]MBC5842075.1 cysteine hydrolase [Flavobacterium kayseriense]MBC5848605.1 cysteine hydrolase [Flavobacterium kayseriense]MBX9887881.1 cysteine hydrolase [Flavobacteriaceae bacterium]